MVIIRDSYCRTVERYELRIDDAYLNEMTNELAKHIVGDVPVITEDTVRAVLNHEWDSPLNITLTWKGLHYESGKTYEEELFSVLSEWIDDDIWNSFVETVDSETDDFETWVDDNR